mgnify:CR=1 FL=1
MANKKLSTSYRKLKHKYEYLTLELEEVEEELHARSLAFKEAYDEYYDLLSDEEKFALKAAEKKRHRDLVEKECESEDELGHRTQEKELKKIYKEIAKQIHPDKFALRPEEVRKEKKALFQKVNKYYEDENLVGLESIAMNLGIEIDAPSEKHLELVENQIARTTNQLQNMTAAPAWEYGDARDETTKLRMMKTYFEALLGR